ncbi:MAG: hypothetical protein A2X87_03855 [Deltaproteobacteria bacterium GWC2_42_51]|nr:MAG: hypothetical protein A2056_00710 [Deltaproteobacteria bacterium GWA2_42_85]OGP26524.1 MAG: hypothetical protein A2067_08210 [Deltaproteobacteria bacterium GWB2_42_7]OGP37438.1 MAG: hypothetical protein A2X87_03855 [Deltaproteobacteria bacterium GWC2_42_51]OGP40128.1 MAG: hypothetical protein A2090_09210 [Deltaproteobacteria bacterium GWD2_42_10]OGP47522.1 MAG: hypothetical protein A2022_09990 [Deltaproteobacteria bacterium GWF2_42_12]OGQ26152.1 MAG: hypothetical protein A3D29_05965 [De
MNTLRWAIYFFSETLRTIKENPTTTFITVITIAISLTICCLFFGVFINLNKMLSSMGGEIQVMVYIKDDISSETLQNIKEQITNMPEVEALEYISKEKAFSIFKNDLKGQTGILEGLNTNPLPSSLEIRMKKDYRNPAGISRLVARLKLINDIDDIQYSKEWIDKLFAFIRFVEAFALIIGSFILMATLFIISNTIRLTIYARREEIEIMEFLGATNIFTKTPFIIEGIIEGFLGAILSIGMLFIVSSILIAKTPKIFAPLSTLPFPVIYLISGIIASGIVLGLIGSSISLRRFLKN